MIPRIPRSVALPLLLLALHPAVNPDPHAAVSRPKAPAAKFYAGISEYQSMRAHEALRSFYNGNKPRAVHILQDLNTHETEADLPPLSQLLLSAMHGLTLHRDETGTLQERTRVREAFDSAAGEGLRRCAGAPDHPSTCGLIEGGIRGFRAILNLNTRGPTDVLAEGLEAVSLLEEALEADSTLQDAHLGLGLFNVMAASNAPRVVRGMLRAAGRGVSQDAGLAHLRRSGYQGQYTSVASQFFLIRFLSPYDDELRREKNEIFRSLRATFPLAPFVPFLQHHEALVFYPDSFYRPRARIALARTIRAVEARDYANQRYVQLLKHQYALLAETPEPRYRPDSAFDLGGYAFYADFMEALRLRRVILEGAPPDPTSTRPLRDTLAHENGASGKPAQPESIPEALQSERAAAIKQVAVMRKDLLARIHKTDNARLNPQTRGLLTWHISHALRTEQFVRPESEAGEAGSRRARGAAAAQVDDVAETRSKAAGKSRKPPER